MKSGRMDDPLFNWETPFTINFDRISGQPGTGKLTQRCLSEMKGMYSDDVALADILEHGNPLVYEFFESGAPEVAGDLAFGTSITYPGKVGNEFFMTKGHFHTVLDTAEVYYCLQGHGYMLMENPEGDWNALELTPGKMVYVPKRWAHRSINIGNEPFITFFVFRGDAGHNYGTIGTKGFRKLIIERNGKVEFVDNPKWK